MQFIAVQFNLRINRGSTRFTMQQGLTHAVQLQFIKLSLVSVGRQCGAANSLNSSKHILNMYIQLCVLSFLKDSACFHYYREIQNEIFLQAESVYILMTKSGALTKVFMVGIRYYISEVLHHISEVL